MLFKWVLKDLQNNVNNDNTQNEYIIYFFQEYYRNVKSYRNK